MICDHLRTKYLKSDQHHKFIKVFFKAALTFSNVMIDLLGKRILEINVLYIMDSVDFWWNAIYHSSENINFRILGFIWYLFKKQASLEERVFRCKSYFTLSGIYYSHLLCFLPHYMHLYYDISIANYSYLSLCLLH